LVSDAPRLAAVRLAHDENLEALKNKKEAARNLEEVVSLEHEIREEKKEVERIDSRLSGVVKATVRLTRVALALGLIMFLASTFGLFNLLGVDDYFQKLSYNYIRFERLGGRSFGDDQIRIILVDPNTRVDGFPHPAETRREDRPYHAELIDALARAGASVVAIDIFLAQDPEGDKKTAGDEKLATSINEAAQKGTQVIMGTKGFNDTGGPLTPVPEALRETLKDRLGNVESAYVAAGFRPAIRAVKLGDEITRGPLHQTSDQGVSVAPSFVLQAIRQFRRQPGSPPAGAFFNKADNTVRLVDGHNVLSIPVDDEDMLYSFGVPDFDRLKTEFARVSSTYQEVYTKRHDPSALLDFRGKLVLIGYQVEDDMHYVNGVRRMPGVEIQAAVASNILQGVHLKNLSGLNNFLVILIMIALGLALQSSRLRRFCIELPFESRVVRKFITIPLPLLIVTLIYLAGIYLIYSQTSWVIETPYHIAALFFSYWIGGLLRQKSHLFARSPTLQPQDRKDVIANA
jgi:CHASE2 domain-containing sensor protein